MVQKGLLPLLKRPWRKYDFTAGGLKPEKTSDNKKAIPKGMASPTSIESGEHFFFVIARLIYVAFKSVVNPINLDCILGALN
jgi:hypothetical protein